MADIPPDENLSHKNTRPVAIVSQLLQQVDSMQHIDELLTWIASTLVQDFPVNAVQIWAVQDYARGVSRRKLRASASQSSIQASQVLESVEITVLAERLLREQRGVLSLPVSSIFSAYQASALAKQACQYWTVYFIRKDALLPPTQGAQKEELLTPLQMVFSFFTQQPVQLAEARAISFLIEQALRIGISKKLLTTAVEKPEEDMQAFLAGLTPERVQAIEIEQAKNPFTSAPTIPDKEMRRAYTLIDGKKNLSQLASLLRMSQRGVLEVLKPLLSQGYIQLRDEEGKPIDNARLT